MKHHRSDVESRKADLENSGISKHARYCTHRKINWETLEKSLKVENEINNFSLQETLLIRERFETKNTIRFSMAK